MFNWFKKEEQELVDNTIDDTLTRLVEILGKVSDRKLLEVIAGFTVGQSAARGLSAHQGVSILEAILDDSTQEESDNV